MFQNHPLVIIPLSAVLLRATRGHHTSSRVDYTIIPMIQFNKKTVWTPIIDLMFVST